MALIEISGTSKPRASSEGSAVRLTYGLAGVSKPHWTSSGSTFRLTYGLAGVSKPHIKATGDFADLVPVASVSVLGIQSLRVTFSEPMAGGLQLETPGNYTFAALGAGAALTCFSATPEAVAEPTYVDLSISEMTDGEAYELTVDPSIVDLQGNPTNAPAAFTGSGGAPEISSATATTATKVRVVYDESMHTADGEIEDPSNYTITPTEAGAVSVSVQSVERGTYNTTTVDLVCSEMTDGKGYKVTVSEAVRDAALNPIVAPGNEAAFTGEGERPTVARVEAISENRMDVVFSEPMKNNAELRDASRYTWDQGLLTVSVLEVDGDTVKLVTSDQEPGLLYTLTISNP
jgi:hypothetical protein